MWEWVVSDVLERVLGTYIDGLNKESIRVGVWRGNLELKNLRLRPDALAILFETLGLDLPVTVTAGYIGLLRLEVPWKSLRSAPVQIFMHDVTVVASPVSDGDQSALELREKRLKIAKLATDEAVRDAKFSMRSVDDNGSLTRSSTAEKLNGDEALDDVRPSGNQRQGGFRVARWGWGLTGLSKVLTKVVDNIQIDVENVIVQYEDSSSVRDRPYTAVVALDSLRACSTNEHWTPVFLEDPSSPVVHKVLFLRGLVLNWEPGSSNNELKQWILDPNADRSPGQWSGMVRESSRHAIKPMDGELRIALTKSSALASALAGSDEKLLHLRNVPRVQMDLHFPQVKIILDDFQYHTLLSTIMYLSDIDRKVRPKKPRDRWFWALERLLPRFKERREAARRFNVNGMRERREKREEYCKARNAVVMARRKGEREPKKQARIVEGLEDELSFDDILLFRDIADRELTRAAKSASSQAVTSVTSDRFWGLLSWTRDPSRTRSQGGSGKSTPKRSRSREQVDDVATTESVSGESGLPSSSVSQDLAQKSGDEGQGDSHWGLSLDGPSDVENNRKEDIVVPNFRMGFLLGRGAIELKEGGFPDLPTPMSSLEFGELRLGIETRTGAGFLLEALLGTFQVIDLRKRMKVMYPRAPWTEDLSQGAARRLNFHNVDAEVQSISSPRCGASNITGEWLRDDTGTKEATGAESRESTDCPPKGAHLDSYPHEISNAISEIRGEYGIDGSIVNSTTLTVPKFGPYTKSLGSASSGSLSALSDGALSGASLPNMEDLSVPSQAPLKYIAALRLNQEEATEGQWASGATRMAMDLAIGGMEVLLDGPRGAFISSIQFWHPREKMPSIMQFLSRAAAPRLASIRMDIQKALLERSVPMRMDMLIRGPRFVVPGSPGSDVSLVMDLGTFAMETSTGPPDEITPEPVSARSKPSDENNADAVDPISIRFTDYKMACTDLGLFVVSEAGKQAAERIITPFSVHVLLQVLHNSAYIEAVTLPFGKVDIPKVKLQAQLPSLRTSVSHSGFRKILDIAKGWGERSRKPLANSGIQPNPVQQSLSVSPELEDIRQARKQESTTPSVDSAASASPLVAFWMRLEFEELQLELRDSTSKRIVTVSSTGTIVKLKQRRDVADFEFKVKTFIVIDGSRGATAPFRRLAYAGVEHHESSQQILENTDDDIFSVSDERSFITLSYHGDHVSQEQVLGVKILSLNLLCVRETYFALADFFYLNDRRGQPAKKTASLNSSREHLREDDLQSTNGMKELEADDSLEGQYADPFAALGMTTSGAARALKEQAEKGMELSKQALVNRGHLQVTADLDGLNVTLVSADGAIGSFDVSDCKVRLTQFSDGAVKATSELGGFGVRDLTAAHEVYAETIRYRRPKQTSRKNSSELDGLSLRIPKAGNGDIWLEARFRNLQIVYLQRFIIILKKYFDALRDSLKPVIEMKGGIGEVFAEEVEDEFPAVPREEGRVRLNIVTENVDILMPRHSQSPYEALRFFVPQSSITNEDLATPGYSIGCQVKADNVSAYVLYQPPAEGEGRALTSGGIDPILRQITPNSPVSELIPFAENMCVVGKLDVWRQRRVPEVVLNADGMPVLKDGEEEREYDPSKWLPALRVRVSAPSGISARLCEAEYSILYFTFTENVIERPDIEFTDIVRGLKTPILPRRRPVQPIMFSSNRMPPNYQILFEVPTVESIIMSGADPVDTEQKLISSELRDVVGSFEYGVDFRMTIEVNANLHSMEDARPRAPTYGKRLIMPVHEPAPFLSPHGGNSIHSRDERSSTDDMSRSITFTWDRPFGFRANVMVVASDLRVIVEPELFRDLGLLTTPGFPYLKSSAPAPQLRFNGRLLIVTVSRPEIWLMANQYPGDGRSLVVRGDVIAKVQWAAVTGRNKVELAANGITVNLSTSGPTAVLSPRANSPMRREVQSPSLHGGKGETRMLYPCDIAMKFEGSGYDPPESLEGDPIKVPGSNLTVNAESVLVRIDVNDAPLILAVGSRLVRLRSSALSMRPLQPGRFDQWIDKGEDGDVRLTLHFALPHSRLMFTDVTDEISGRYIPIMEARIKNAVVNCTIPWLTNATFDFALDLFNEEKGWWEPGVESFPINIAIAKGGRSGSQAINIAAKRKIDVNVTPNTVSGAARVSKALKEAIEDLIDRLKSPIDEASTALPAWEMTPVSYGITSQLAARRPSLAAFCVRNETGRTMSMWLPRDSKRRTLRGNGGEAEVGIGTDELSWTGIGAASEFSIDARKDDSMCCFVSLSGYETKVLSTAETGLRLVTFQPDNHDFANLSEGGTSQPSSLTLVWEVAMRDGVPCGFLRSVLRLVNKTDTILEINIGGIMKSVSVSGGIGSMAAYVPAHHDTNAHVVLQAGEAWCVPVHAVHRPIRVRPHILQAPETDAASSDENIGGAEKKGRVYYKFKWSDPLSKVSALHSLGWKLNTQVKGEAQSSRNLKNTSLEAPLMSCRGVRLRQLFSFSVLPVVDISTSEQSAWSDRYPSWLDIHICPPLIFENLLPRPLRIKLATPLSASGDGQRQIVEDCHLEPLRQKHIYSAGSDLSRVSIAVGTESTSQISSPRNTGSALPSRHVGDFHSNLASLNSMPMGAGRYVPFKLKFDQQQTLSTRHVRAFCDFWISNRSDTDIFFRDSEQGRDARSTGPKVFLRGRPPGSNPDKYVCFSGPFLSFQRGDATEDVWVTLSTEVSEIDKPTSIEFEGLSLLLEVRPAEGRFHRALIVTIRNAVWLENRTGSLLQWCQPAALNPHGIALSAKVHSIRSGTITALHWDFASKAKSICLRRVGDSGSNDWIWSRPVNIEGIEGEFAAKMYRPKRHEQYIARVVISKLGSGVSAVVVHREDRNTPPYRIVNHCRHRSIAFRQSGVNETHPWLVRPGKTTRYSWDDPQTPAKRRSLVVEVIEESIASELEEDGEDASAADISRSESMGSQLSDATLMAGAAVVRREKPGKHQKFELSIDMIGTDVPYEHSKAFQPRLKVSVHVEGPTKVVTFSDVDESRKDSKSTANTSQLVSFDKKSTSGSQTGKQRSSESMKNLDVEVFVKSLGISFVESTPVELAYLSVCGIHIRLDRFDGQQLFLCQVQDLQLDNQLAQCTWPVVLWSPPPLDSKVRDKRANGSASFQSRNMVERKPFFQLTVDGPYPSVKGGIGTFRGIFLALQQLQLAADEDFVLRIWMFVVSLLDAVGGADREKEEPLSGKDRLDVELMNLRSTQKSERGREQGSDQQNSGLLNRLYVERLELCPLKLTISFTSSRTSEAVEHIGGFRSLIRTLVALLGNVENAEFRFNALELEHVFDTTSHFRSLITEFYVSQGSNQKMVLLASTSLMGNPSALFDSIAVGARDFFVEPANAKGSADFIASIGRGSSSLLTNTFGALVGSIGGIPKAVAQGLELAVGDRDFLAERDSIRGGKARVASSPAQGLYTGAVSFGHSIASGLSGLIRDPIQGAAEEGPSGFIRGLGKGVIGSLLKPVTGALDLIAEPAAGFRSMMVSERDKYFAEPVRPPRGFRGANGDRMTAYDLREALGQTIFKYVTRGEIDHIGERLRYWTHLIPVHASAHEDDVIAFLWALVRRSTQPSHFQSRYLLDAQGTPQRAEKLRAGLITNKRLIITSLDGHVIWEHPLLDIAHTYENAESKNYLMVGTRPVGTRSEKVAPTSWQRIHCGSVASQKELNMYMGKVLEEAKAKAANQVPSLELLSRRSERKQIPMKQRSGDHHRDKSVEMKDMGATSFTDDASEQMHELKPLHHDTSTDGQRGVFTNINLPGRAHRDQLETTESPATSTDLSFQLAVAMECPPSYQVGAIRSVRLLLLNNTNDILKLQESCLRSGVWSRSPAGIVDPMSISVFEADGGSSRVSDVCGHVQFAIGDSTNKDQAEIAIVIIRFLNPLLAPNAFSVKVSCGYAAAVSGGEKGDHVTAVVTLKTSPKLEDMLDETEPAVEKKRSAEPLLFGRSKVSPYLPPVKISPPHAPKEDSPNPNDPELVEKLSSLGFSKEAAVSALAANDGDLSKAYAFLLDKDD